MRHRYQKLMNFGRKLNNFEKKTQKFIKKLSLPEDWTPNFSKILVKKKACNVIANTLATHTVDWPPLSAMYCLPYEID